MFVNKSVFQHLGGNKKLVVYFGDKVGEIVELESTLH